MSHIMRKPDFCLCDNKDADQLCSNCTADQRLCFCYTNSIIFLKSWAQRERVVTVFFIIFQERQKTFSFFFKANPRDVN